MMKYKAFLSFLKGYHWSKYKKKIGRWEFDFKNGGQYQQPSILCQLVTGESPHTGISCLKES